MIEFDAPGGSVSIPPYRTAPVRPEHRSLIPTDLENLIEAYRLIGTLERDPELKRQAFERMGELIAQRSPETIAKMEASRGLAR